MRDETDLHGLKITIDLKRGIDPDKLMLKLFKMTPLEDTFSCNFNILVGNMPAVMGIKQILNEWIIFRKSCVFRKISYELARKKDKLHLLKGLSKILLDIDKAIKIVRETKEEKEVVANLMIGFGIDQIQADYVAEIRLRQLNGEYILKRIQEISSLEQEIIEMQSTLSDTKKLETILIEDLKTVIKKYSQPRRSLIYHPSGEKEDNYIEEIIDYPVNLFLTKDNYFKKITPLSLRMSGEQKLKEGDQIITTVETTNKAEILFFTDKQQVYKAFAHEFDDTKSSVLGEYIPAKLNMDDGENIKYMAVTTDFIGYMLYFFENGKIAKVDLNAYQTKTKRKKLLKSFSDKSPVVTIAQIREDTQFVLTSSSGRLLIVHTGVIASKTTKDTQGISVLLLKQKHTLTQAKLFVEQDLANAHRFRSKTIPSIGAIPKENTIEQLTLMGN
ncbi:MAG: DNA gyrase subunit A, partial [Oscillospiraceae bacterium]